MEGQMRIIFYNQNNRFLRHDGDEFTARAGDCCDYWRGLGHVVNNYALPKANDAAKRLYVRSILDTLPTQSVDRIAVFGHGTSGWCDLGVTVATLPTITPNLDRVLTDDARIGLYCCLTGKSINGLAGTLSRAIGGIPVLCHTTSGHTSRNPFKRTIDGMVITNLWPNDKAAFKAWQKDLQTDNWAAFELLEVES
jgi:hypothetical protein